PEWQPLCADVPEPHWGVRNLTGVPGASLGCQEPYWGARSLTGVSGASLGCQEPQWGVRSLTGVPGTSLGCQEPPYAQSLVVWGSLSAQDTPGPVLQPPRASTSGLC
uniref:Uncharacterized protein n=1 Tax=Cyanistes caeruleus TaxID=156563 RepID=A0A8C0UG70_CYACU